MLLPIRNGLAPSAVFLGLNALMREVLLASCSGRAVDQSNFPEDIWHAVQANEPTRAHLQAVRDVIDATDTNIRYELYLAFQEVTSVRQLFSDQTLAIPEPPEAVTAELKKLAAHLFERTSKLADITRACGESIKDHYSRYSADPAPGNGNVCGMCATELLSQRRSYISANEQWRAPYDHLLAKEKYPQFGVDPDNLLPTCHTCNSKAKLAKDLLHNSEGDRRICFDPWVEHAHGKVILRIDFDLIDLTPKVSLFMTPADVAEQEKLETWNDVYRIKERIDGEFITLREKLAEDLDPSSLENFKRSIESKKIIKMSAARLTPYNYWRSLLYAALTNFPDQTLEQLRILSLEGLDPYGDAAATYGI
ncbi:TPA: hypothetical protein ACWLT0_003898 [Pseudomonas aeruginosa]